MYTLPLASIAIDVLKATKLYDLTLITGISGMAKRNFVLRMLLYSDVIGLLVSLYCAAVGYLILFFF